MITPTIKLLILIANLITNPTLGFSLQKILRDSSRYPCRPLDVS